MSILINGIEMPKEPWECPCYNGENGRCNVTQKVCFEIPKDCPLSSAHLECLKGHWIIDGHHVQCSVCAEMMCNTDREGDKISMNFCPNCGADMRGEKE